MLRVTDNITLKNSDIYYRVEKSEQLFKAIRFYGTKLLNVENRYLVKICQRLRKRNNLEKI